MKQGDRIIFLILLVALVIASMQFFIPNTQSKSIVIRSDGIVVKKISLTRNKTEEFNIRSKEGNLIVEIKAGRVRVIESTCKDKLCVKEGWIEKVGESIVCLPNRISISIVGEKENGIDSITY